MFEFALFVDLWKFESNPNMRLHHLPLADVCMRPSYGVLYVLLV